MIKLQGWASLVPSPWLELEHGETQQAPAFQANHFSKAYTTTRCLAWQSLVPAKKMPPDRISWDGGPWPSTWVCHASDGMARTPLEMAIGPFALRVVHACKSCITRLAMQVLSPGAFCPTKRFPDLPQSALLAQGAQREKMVFTMVEASSSGQLKGRRPASCFGGSRQIGAVVLPWHNTENMRSTVVDLQNGALGH